MPAAEETGDFIIPAVSNGHRVSGTHGWYHSRSKHLIQYIQSEACQTISVYASTIWSLLQRESLKTMVYEKQSKYTSRSPLPVGGAVNA